MKAWGFALLHTISPKTARSRHHQHIWRVFGMRQKQMVKFYYRDIKVEAIVKMTRYDYRDANNVGRTRFDRNVYVTVAFWDFVIENNLDELALIKSTLNYYMQCYWKRSSKQGQKIDLATTLEHNDKMQKLNLIARQKDNKHSLEVSLTENNQQINFLLQCP